MINLNSRPLLLDQLILSRVVKTAILYRVGCATSTLSCTNISRIPDRIYKREEDRPLNAIGFLGVGHYRLLHLSNTHKASESQPPKDNKGGIDGHATINMGLHHGLSVDLSYGRIDVLIFATTQLHSCQSNTSVKNNII